MSSSGVILRASHLVEGKRAWTPGLGSGNVVFQTGIKHDSFFTCMKKCGGDLTGTLRYTMTQEQACIIDVKLRSLIRVVTMRLRMDMILLVKLYHPSDGSSFTSVSTYIQNNSSDFPSSIPSSGILRASHMPPNTHLSSSRVAFGPQGLMGGCQSISMVTSSPGALRGKANPPTLG